MSQLGYNDLVTFKSTDEAGGTVYHTNVMMSIGTGVCWGLCRGWGRVRGGTGDTCAVACKVRW